MPEPLPKYISSQTTSHPSVDRALAQATIISAGFCKTFLAGLPVLALAYLQSISNMVTKVIFSKHLVPCHSSFQNSAITHFSHNEGQNPDTSRKEGCCVIYIPLSPLWLAWLGVPMPSCLILFTWSSAPFNLLILLPQKLPWIPCWLVSSSSCQSMLPWGLATGPLWSGDHPPLVSQVSAQLILWAKALTANFLCTIFSGMFCIAGGLGK